MTRGFLSFSGGIEIEHPHMMRASKKFPPSYAGFPKLKSGKVSINQTLIFYYLKKRIDLFYTEKKINQS